MTKHNEWSSATPAPTPHKSTTHEERFYHVTIDGVEDETKRGTVFFRKETRGIFAAVAVCHANDQFSRRIGRNISRRKYFRGQFTPVTEMSYEVAEAMLFNARGCRL